jgi:hypothetical protein
MKCPAKSFNRGGSIGAPPSCEAESCRILSQRENAAAFFGAFSDE